VNQSRCRTGSTIVGDSIDTLVCFLLTGLDTVSTSPTTRSGRRVIPSCPPRIVPSIICPFRVNCARYVAKVFQFATLASGVVPFLFYAFQVQHCLVFVTFSRQQQPSKMVYVYQVSRSPFYLQLMRMSRFSHFVIRWQTFENSSISTILVWQKCYLASLPIATGAPYRVQAMIIKLVDWFASWRFVCSA